MPRGRKTKLTRKLIAPICERVKQRMTQKEIADFLGIDPKTFRNWRERGHSEEKGIYRELVDAMDHAEAEMYSECVKVIQEGILGGATQITRKVKLENGMPVKTEITEKTLLPNPKLALEVVERLFPERWGRYETLRLEGDLRVEVEQMGLEYEEVMAAVMQMLESLMTGNPVEVGALVLPEMSESNQEES
jgi:hypothetical protein